MKSFDKDAPTSLYYQLKEIIKEDIEQGRLFWLTADPLNMCEAYIALTATVSLWNFTNKDGIYLK